MPELDIECRIQLAHLNNQLFGILEAQSGLLQNLVLMLGGLDPKEARRLLSAVGRCRERIRSRRAEYNEWLKNDISWKRLCRGDRQAMLPSGPSKRRLNAAG